ncbi:flagellar motor protein MotA, partial [Streptosporangium nondiastaticum]
TSDDYPHKLSSPMAFFWTMVIFLIIVGFVAAILFRQAQAAFFSNPGLSGLILGVLLIGILLVFNHVLALRPEVRWFNSFRAAGSAEKVGRDPVLLAPMRALIGRHHSVALSTATLRSILDSIATRLDESRDTSR